MRESGVPEIPLDLHQRAYVPTLAELIDRLCIVQLKAIFIAEHKEEYEKEINLIMTDIDIVLEEKESTFSIGSRSIRAIAVLMLCNRYIWENESKARAGGNDQDHLLKLTHSINGVRNTAKNILSEVTKDRKDYKVDALSADLPSEFGNWRIFK